MKMLVILLIALLCLPLPVNGKAMQAVSGSGPPQLEGVWYTTYTIHEDGEERAAEMWLEISHQEPTNGLQIKGFNRWNISNDTGSDLSGPLSQGQSAQYFDSFTGSLDKSDNTISIIEETRRATITGQLIDENTIDIAFTRQGEQEVAFTATLQRIATLSSQAGIHVLGIDVSHHSGSVDWQRVKNDGYRFAFVKATEGVDDADPMFEKHWQQLQEIHLPHGAYHFFVTEDDPEVQARFFLSRLQHHPGTLPPVVDVEVIGANTHGDLSARLLRFLEIVEQALGTRPIIYTAPKFWDSHYRPEFSNYPLWMAEYGVEVPKVPFGWQAWDFWQYAMDKPVAGVEKSADVSLLHPESEMAELLQPHAQ